MQNDAQINFTSIAKKDHAFSGNINQSALPTLRVHMREPNRPPSHEPEPDESPSPDELPEEEPAILPDDAGTHGPDDPPDEEPYHAPNVDRRFPNLDPMVGRASKQD